MSKYCPECGEKNSEEASYCLNCGTKLDLIDTQNNPSNLDKYNESSAYQYNGENQLASNPKKSYKKYRLITIISVISVVGILIGAYLISGYLYDGGINNPTINKTSVKGGPKFNIESIVTSGNALTTPEIGHTAVYGYYLSGEKLGEVSFTTVGEENYNGEKCDKISGDGNFYFEIYGQSLGVDFNIDAYISKSDGKLAYFYYDFEITQPFNINMDMILDINKDTGEITVTVDSSLIGSTSTVIKTSEDYWDCTLLNDDLYVGYQKEVSYTMNVLGYDTEVSLVISVIGQEDVIVKKGTFEDCYIIQIDQVQGSTTTTSTIWIDENGICPKMEIGSNGSSSICYEGMMIELEEYYTTY